MAEGAAAAVKAALDLSATSEARQNATVFLDAMKIGDVRVLGTTAFELCKQNQALEVRYYGLKLLQHLIRIRWVELNKDERQKITAMVMDMLSEFAKPYEEWSIKSQTAALAAEVGRREGPSVWKVPLFSASEISPIHAEMVAMVLRWLPEDVIVHNEDLESLRRKSLLLELTNILPELFVFLFKMLEAHFGAATEAAKRNQVDLANQHAAVVKAALNAVLAYAEWAPITDFSSHGLVEACGFLLNSSEFRLTSCEILKQLVSRKRLFDEAPETFNPVISRVFDILSPVCEAYFQHLHGGGSDAFEFAECLCNALAAIGLLHLQSISCNELKVALYFKQMLAFLQHPEFTIHVQALPVWLTLVRDSLTPTDQSKAVASPGEKKAGLISMDTVAVLLDVAFQKFLKEAQEDEFSLATDYSQYRGRLIELVRLSTSLYPTLGITKVLQRFNILLDSNIYQELSNLESTQSVLDAAVAGVVASSAFTQTSELNSILEGLLQRLLSIQWSKPELVELHAKFFDALGPYLKHVPNAVLLVVQKLFQLFSTVPLTSKEENPANQKARFQVCTSLLRLAVAAGPALSPHLQLLAETIASLQEEHRLLRSEHIMLCESLLTAAGTDQQVQVLEWVLGPFREHWLGVEWQQKYLHNPAGLVELLLNVKDDVGMWYIYHSIALFEKAFRRCGPVSEHSLHPMAVHVSWILPPLIQLLRCLHSLWCPSVLSTLPPVFHHALQLSVTEQAAILGEIPTRSGDGREDELRNWLKGVRDNGYNVLNFASYRLRDSFFSTMVGMAGSVSTALTENLSSMEFRHIRHLSHSVIQPFLKICPRSLWGPWLGQLLPPLLIHCHAKLPTAWQNLVKDGAPKMSTSFAPSTELKTELIEERMLRDLTREVCSVLALLASPELNRAEQEGMLFFIIQYPDAALAALQLGILSLQWPDSEAVHKGAVFCGAVINLAVVANDPRLREIVAKDMFTAVIQSLTLESNSVAQADLLGLLREILVRLSPHTSAPKEVLMSLPSVTQQEFETFESTFCKTLSAKDQRLHIRNLLLAAGGDHLKALKPQKNTNVVTNVTRSTQRREKRKTEAEGAGPIGLATLMHHT